MCGQMNIVLFDLTKQYNYIDNITCTDKHNAQYRVQTLW